MNKWLMLVVLVLMVLVSAFGLRNLAATQVKVAPTISAGTGMPVPVFPSTGKLVAGTGMPVPVFPSTGKGGVAQ
jgi:hypothetical protein